ncbi:hypothetical protein ACWCQP_47340 [Streptomyces chartreusis]
MPGRNAGRSRWRAGPPPGELDGTWALDSGEFEDAGRAVREGHQQLVGCRADFAVQDDGVPHVQRRLLRQGRA